MPKGVVSIPSQGLYWLQVQILVCVGGVQEATDGCFSHVNKNLSLGKDLKLEKTEGELAHEITL